MFIDDLLNKYSKISFPEEYKEISKIDKSISWYFADSSQQFITLTDSSISKIIELDIKQAFTSICKCLFDGNTQFIKEMNAIEDKKSRNIYIATHLNSDQLRWLNIISKIIIMGVTFEANKDNNILLLELKKDGVVISCDSEINNTINKLTNGEPIGEFTEYIFNNNFKISLDYHMKYIRCNRTSYFWSGQNLTIKGQYKYCPIKIYELQNKILKEEDVDFSNYEKIFSQNYFNILVTNNLNEVLKDYYLCNNNKYLSQEGKYIQILKEDNISSRNYLKTFIYPIMLSTKL